MNLGQEVAKEQLDKARSQAHQPTTQKTLQVTDSSIEPCYDPLGLAKATGSPLRGKAMKVRLLW